MSIENGIKNDLQRRIEYSDAFKEMIRNNPGVINLFNKLSGQLIHNTTPGAVFLEENEVKVSLLDYYGTQESESLNRHRGKYFKVEVGGSAYFVKCKWGYYEEKGGGGVDEGSSINLVKEITKNIKDVDVADFQLGYQDKRTYKSYFISSWINGVNLSRFLGKKTKDLTSNESDPERRLRYNLLCRFKELEEILDKNFYDVSTSNMIYNPDTDIITIIDVHKKPTE